MSSIAQVWTHSDNTTTKPDGTSTNTIKKTDTDNTTGDQKTTTTTIKNNPDGSTETTTTTTTVNNKTGQGSSTSTTITKDAAGSPTGTTTGTSSGSAEAACKEDSKAKGCSGDDGKVAVFGDCLAPPICEGDAIECAIAAQVFQHKCFDEKQVDDLTKMSQYTHGIQVLAGTDPEASTLPSPGNAEHVDVPSVGEGTGFLSGSSCFPDLNFSVLGQSIHYSFASVCDQMFAFRWAVLALGALSSLYILTGIRSKT